MPTFILQAQFSHVCVTRMSLHPGSFFLRRHIVTTSALRYPYVTKIVPVIESCLQISAKPKQNVSLCINKIDDRMTSEEFTARCK